ncbi:MAG: S8 family serine peptidase, partial [candidate division Zixibacteria bacterium]|nr:S8 family serine peptidase [candidate division Zixibacteria bacterium]
MKKFLTATLAVAVAAILLIASAGTVNAGEIDPGLENILASKPTGQPISVLVYLSDQANLKQLNQDLTSERATMARRHETVLNDLKVRADRSQPELVQYLRSQGIIGSVKDVRLFWLSNTIELKANRNQIERIASLPTVERVYYNYEIGLVRPESVTDATSITNAVEIGISAIRADEVWGLGITGAGVKVANIDTGVDGDHPALASRWAGVADSRYANNPEWAFFDPYLGQNDFPYDDDGHGSHTMGTMCGGAPGDQVGVAPGATWIAAAAV